MINLLPLKERQNLFFKRREKLAAILGIAVIVFLVCLALILLSIKFYILAETDSQKNILMQTEQKNKTAEFINLNSIIQKYNGILAPLDLFYKKEIYFNQALNIITGIPSPEGLYLTNFSLSRDADGSVKASISGVSGTRDNLLIFKKNIEDNKEIKNISFSQESWVSPKNVKFSATFEIDKNEGK